MISEKRHEHWGDRQKKTICNRLGRIEGQIRGITKMVETDVYCEDILNQLASAKAALNGVIMILFENHTKHCIVPSVTETGIESVQELTRLVKRLIA
jgi:DNA-binding FrmR family transcriptional regulator